MHHCPHCDGLLAWLGRLGRLVWFRCRDCGMQCSLDYSMLEDDDA